MDIRTILKTLVFIILTILVIILLVYFSLQSDFAKVNSKQGSGGSDAGYKMKTKYYKELYYSTQCKRDSDNKNLLSLGHFTINLVNDRKLVIKASIKTDEETIDIIMDNQAVIRNDVINSVVNLKSSNVTPKKISSEIQKYLNNRFKDDTVKDVYLEEFLIQ